MKVLFFLLLFSFLTDCTSLFMSLYDRNLSTYNLINAYTLIEACTLFFVFKKLEVKFPFWMISIVFLALGTYEWLHLEKNQLLDYSSGTESLIIIILSLLFFKKTLGSLEYSNILNNPQFWMNSGLLIYFTGNLFLFAFGNLIHNDSLYYLWHIHNFIQLIYSSLLAIAFWKVKEN